MAWTHEQSDAILSDGNLLVAAAAGSGKTAVLTERIVRLIIKGASPEEFLVVTFTKAAAAEMKKRIELKLREQAAKAQQDGTLELAQRLNDAASAICRANISTMHSFCARVLRRHFSSAGLDPAFRVADETQTAILKKEILEELIDERYESENNENFILLSELLGGDDALFEAAEQIFEFMFSQPDPMGWLRDAAEKYMMTESQLACSEAVCELVSFAKAQLTAEIDTYLEVRDDYANTSYEKLVSFMDNEAMRLRALLLAQNYAEFSASLSEFTFEKAPSFPRGTSDEDKAPFKTARDKSLKPLIKKLADMFASPLSKEAQRLNEYYPIVCELCSFMEDFVTKYSHAKSKISIIDYSDMEHMTLNVLKDELIAGEYREKFKYIFVDEYQDSNRVQEHILNSLKRNDNLFLVGDVKQSIYGFRLAEPRLFTEKYDLYADQSKGRRIDLNANFRSSQAVISTVNEMFGTIMHRDNCGIEYDENAALHAGLEDTPTGNVEFHLIDRCFSSAEAWADDSTEDDDTAYALTAAEAEARIAAAKIREIIASQEYFDPKSRETRPYTYSDFAILHHSPKNVAQHWVETLSNEGIPALADHSGSYFDAIEVQIFMNLLRVIDNRRQDIPLMSVLRSPIGGFSTDELILLVSNYRTGENDAILDALLRAADDGTSLGEKCRILLGNIENWQNECRLLGLCEFLDLLLAQTHFYEYVSALCGGEVRSSNLDALIMRAQDFTLNGSNSLSAFITYMDKANKYGSVSAVQKSTSDVVSIMSIHKSKGLEYPVVILAGLDAKFNSSESGNTVLMDSELGIGLRLTSGNKRFDTFYRKSIALRLANKNTAERMRLLYVAMTRAKEQLIMVGALKDIEKRCLSVPKTLTKERAMRANTFLDWLIHLKIQPHIHLAPTASLSCEALDESLYRKFTVQASLPVSDNSMSPFAWSYPFMAATKVPSKVSVSKLDGNVLSSRILPDFVIQKEGIFNAAQRGTATHTVMEHITIMPHTFESVEKEIARLVLEGHLLKEEAEAVNRASIVGFFASDIGRRLCASDRIERELKFNHRINASAVMDAPDDEKILLQGMIDCCFIEDGEWVILDYKTDYIAYPSEKYEAAQKHKKQVSLYADALFALSGIQVKEKYVCFLRLKDGCVKL